jgi:SAM-dependent methyltransferase
MTKGDFMATAPSLTAPQQIQEYQEFWDSVGGGFPSLKGAASTLYYFACERRLLETYFPPLKGRSLLKTDLWDEAKNTEILRWAAEQGAQPVGLDIAADVVAAAGRILNGHQPFFAVGDVRAIPFASGSVDLVYSMGTIEHFPEYATAVDEMFRVLKPGGRAIIGVPNKADPFLRPLMVHLMNTFRLYDYGMEKSFTHGQLKRLLERSGFKVVGQSGVLFIPGWLRMLDLLVHTRAPWLSGLVRPIVAPFAWLFEHVPAVRRHGYLIAAVCTKPEA